MIRSYLARNVLQYRERRGWSQQHLADELNRLGIPCDRTTVAKIEAGDDAAKARKVTVDELVGIAFALNVSPIALLLPRETDDNVKLTPEVTASSGQAAWSWMRGTHSINGGPNNVDGRLYQEAAPDFDVLAEQDFPGLYDLRRLAANLVGAITLRHRRPMVWSAKTGRWVPGDRIATTAQGMAGTVAHLDEIIRVAQGMRERAAFIAATEE